MMASQLIESLSTKCKPENITTRIAKRWRTSRKEGGRRHDRYAAQRLVIEGSLDQPDAALEASLVEG